MLSRMRMVVYVVGSRNFLSVSMTCRQKCLIHNVLADDLDLQFALSKDPKAMLALFKHMGKTASSGAKVLWDLIYLALDALPLFWCVHHRKRVLIRNMRLVQSYFAPLYAVEANKQCLQLVASVANHGSAIRFGRQPKRGCY